MRHNASLGHSSMYHNLNDIITELILTFLYSVLDQDILLSMVQKTLNN